MAILKRPPESVARALRLEQPLGEPLDRDARFADCSAD